jgi:hypothetical protein
VARSHLRSASGVRKSSTVAVASSVPYTESDNALMRSVFTDPPFAASLRSRFRTRARLIGLVAGLAAALGVLVGLLAVPNVLQGLSECTATNALPPIEGVPSLPCTDEPILGFVIPGVATVLLGDICATIGGLQMYRLERRGKELVVYALAVATVGGAIAFIGWGNTFGSFLYQVVIAAVLYPLAITSRFPGEPLAPGPAFGQFASAPPPFQAPTPPIAVQSPGRSSVAARQSATPISAYLGAIFGVISLVASWIWLVGLVAIPDRTSVV